MEPGQIKPAAGGFGERKGNRCRTIKKKEGKVPSFYTEYYNYLFLKWAG